MSLGLLLAAAVASCTPDMDARADEPRLTRDFFGHMSARRYDQALALVKPEAAYFRGDTEGSVEELVNQLASGGDSVSTLEVLDTLGVEGVVAVKYRVDYGPDDPTFRQISVFTFSGGCIASVRDY